jgi:hypothetical protein
MRLVPPAFLLAKHRRHPESLQLLEKPATKSSNGLNVLQRRQIFCVLRKLNSFGD